MAISSTEPGNDGILAFLLEVVMGAWRKERSGTQASNNRLLSIADEAQGA